MNSSLSPERRSEITLQNISTSDCGVIALQAITGLTRSEAERLCGEVGGYQIGIGIARGGLNRVLFHLSYNLTMMRVWEEPGLTVASFATTYEYGRFLIYTESHVSALVDGDLFNAKGDWHAPVEEAYRVEPGSAT